MPEFELFATAQGTIVKKVLSTPQEASVIGITSRGLFLSVGPRRIIFLSFETYKGPLTLNLEGEISSLRRLDQNRPAEIRDGLIRFPSPGITIHTANAEIWDLPPRPSSVLSPPERRQRIKAVASQMLARRKVSLSQPLANFLELEYLNGQASSTLSNRVDLAEFYRIIHQPNPPDILAALQPMLGLGTGLTPSGDDLIVGLLLAYNRWGDLLKPGFDVKGFSEAVTRLAFQKTTRISANLIDCAAQGLADERLIAALDGLMTGSAGITPCAEYLSAWGSSSGIDTLAGLALALI